MKKFKKIIPILATASVATVPFAMTSLTSCKTLHVHTFTSDWEYDETQHWKTCEICHEKFDVHGHNFNELNDTCLTCGYVDPLVHYNNDTDKVVTSLTPHAKSKYVLNLPKDCKGIGEHALAGSKAVTVRINKECMWYHKNLWEEGRTVILTFEDPYAQWIDKGEIMIRDPELADAEAKVGDRVYKTLKEAIESPGVGNTTVLLLKDNIKIVEPIKIDHPVTLVSTYSSTILTGDFNITGAGILYIPETVNYQGDTKLKLGEVEEVRADTDSLSEDNTYDTVYNSGSLVFTHRSTKPIGVNVSYVSSFSGGTEYPAVGAHQVVNDLLVIPVDNYAWGTLRFSEDFKTIKGLTEYGKTVNSLTITQAVEGIPATIGKYAFNTISCITVRYRGKEIYHVFFHWLKGMFFHLTIGKGITEIGHSAFNCNYDADIGREMIAAIAPIFSHIFDLTIGYDLVKIDGLAFHDSVSLERVIVSDAVESVNKECQLDVIGSESFRNSLNLVSVDLSRAIHLDVIDEDAFNNCRNLSQAILPALHWEVDDDDASGPGLYFPYDFNSERAAYLLSHESAKWISKGALSWDRVWYSQNLPYVDHPSKNKYGWFNYVTNCDDRPQDRFDELDDGNEIYIADKPIYGSEDIIEIHGAYLEKSVSIVASEDAKVRITTPQGRPLRIKPGCYLALSNVRIDSDIILECEDESGDGGYHNPAGFAINPLYITSSDKVNVSFARPDGQTIQAVPNKINLRGRAHDGYGLCDFKFDENGNTVLFDIPRENNIDMGLARSSQNITLGHQTVPAKDGAKVIVDGTAMSNDSRKGWMTRISLSDDVEQVKGGFFSNSADGKHKGFEKLIEFIGGKGLRNIGTDEFRGSPALTYVSLQDVDGLGPTDKFWIHGCAFQDCPNLLSVGLPNGLTHIWGSSFKNCKSLQSIEIPKTVQEIDENAFKGCKSLMSVRLADGSVLKRIGVDAFDGCTNMWAFYFGSNVEDWGYIDEEGPEIIPIPADGLSDPEWAADWLTVDPARHYEMFRTEPQPE